MKFLFIIFLLFVFLVFIFGFSIIRLLFGGLFGTRPQQSASKSQSKNQTKTNQTNNQKKSNPTKKIITPDEGEYIDFEEIKD